jgi:hypothetical protein
MSVRWYNSHFASISIGRPDDTDACAQWWHA